jgi:hypothetical protein
LASIPWPAGARVVNFGDSPGYLFHDQCTLVNGIAPEAFFAGHLGRPDLFDLRARRQAGVSRILPIQREMMWTRPVPVDKLQETRPLLIWPKTRFTCGQRNTSSPSLKSGADGFLGTSVRKLSSYKTLRRKTSQLPGDALEPQAVVDERVPTSFFRPAPPCWDVGVCWGRKAKNGFEM